MVICILILRGKYISYFPLNVPFLFIPASTLPPGFAALQHEELPLSTSEEAEDKVFFVCLFALRQSLTCSPGWPKLLLYNPGFSQTPGDLLYRF